jgi:hypothetical protein
VKTTGLAALVAAALLLAAPSAASAAFRISDVSVSEGDGAAHAVSLAVSDDGPATSTRCIRYELDYPEEALRTGNIAQVGLDFTLDFPFICLGAGQTQAAITINVIADDEREPDEQVAVELHRVSGAVEFADRTGVLTIENDDGSTVSRCILYLETVIRYDVKSAKKTLRGLGIRKLLTNGDPTIRKRFDLLWCGNGVAKVTVRYGSSVVAKMVARGKYDHYVKVHGSPRFKLTKKARRLEDRSKAKLKITVKLTDPDGASLTRSRFVTIRREGTGGGGSQPR